MDHDLKLLNASEWYTWILINTDNATNGKVTDMERLHRDSSVVNARKSKVNTASFLTASP